MVAIMVASMGDLQLFTSKTPNPTFLKGHFEATL